MACISSRHKYHNNSGQSERASTLIDIYRIPNVHLPAKFGGACERTGRTKMCALYSLHPIYSALPQKHIYKSTVGRERSCQSSSSQSSDHAGCLLDRTPSAVLYNRSSCCSCAFTLRPTFGSASSISTPSFQLCTVHVP